MHGDVVADGLPVQVVANCHGTTVLGFLYVVYIVHFPPYSMEIRGTCGAVIFIPYSAQRSSTASYINDNFILFCTRMLNTLHVLKVCEVYL